MNYFSKFICGGALLLGLGACSNDEPGQDPGNISDGESKYLSVQILSTSADGSRATSTGFENGQDVENEVSKIRFYFFDAGGENAKVCKLADGSYRNFYDWEPAKDPNYAKPSTSPGTTGQNVEKIMQAVVVINTAKGDKLPAKILAVVNPITTAGYPNDGLQKLRSEYRDYAKEANENSKFVMANSVYADNDKSTVISATSLAVTDFKTSEDEAKANPVSIYVERNVAQVRAVTTTGLFTEGTNMIKAKIRPTTPDGTPEDLKVFASGALGETTLEQVYLKINGWAVTSYMPKATLSKHIDLAWGNDLGFEWNSYSNFRSYWADANEIGGESHVNIPYTAITKNFGSNNKIYVNENADRNDDIEPTKIIISATVCKANGSPLTVCEFMGIKFIDGDDLTGLKNNVLKYCNNTGHSHYKKVSDNNWVEISQSDITFVQNYNASSRKYEVYATLTDDAKKLDWKLRGDGDSNDPTTWTTSTADDVSDHLKEHKAKIYKSGSSYFFSPIIHFEDDETSLPGVVRNHIYEITVSGFYGLGTPVYDPNWEIETEKIQDEDAYLAAQVRILSWKIVRNSVIFDDKEL